MKHKALQEFGEFLFAFIKILFAGFLLVLIIAFFVSSTTKPRRAIRIACIHNLKQVGIAMRLYAEDHDGKLPMQGATAEFTKRHEEAWRHFAEMGKEISNPRILVCPADKEADQAGHDFERFQGNQFTSYFMGIYATPDNPNSILSGDADIYFYKQRLSLNAAFPLNINYNWGNRHLGGAGNLLFADGRTEGFTTPKLIEAIRKQYALNGN